MASRSSRKKRYPRDDLPTQWSEYAWDPAKSCWSRYRLDKQGEYEFEDAPAEKLESSSTSLVQDSESPEIPRSSPSSDIIQGDSSQVNFGTSPDYALESTRTRSEFGALNLNKGKEQETYNVDLYPALLTPIVPVVLNASTAVGMHYNMASNRSIYDAQHPQSIGASSSQQPYYSSSAWQNNRVNPTQSQRHTGENYVGAATQVLENPPDSRFKLHNGSEFKYGKVFKILWAAPTGGNGTQLTEDPMHFRKFQEDFRPKIRRFVVVKTFQAHCLCLPIQTYNRRATTNSGVRAQDHAVIYSEKPVTYHGENLTKRAIRVEMVSPREKLAPESRLNYAKVYTVEYNVKTVFIGRVHPNYRHQLLADYHNTMGMGDDGFQEPNYPYGDTITMGPNPDGEDQDHESNANRAASHKMVEQSNTLDSQDVSPSTEENMIPLDTETTSKASLGHSTTPETSPKPAQPSPHVFYQEPLSGVSSDLRHSLPEISETAEIQTLPLASSEQKASHELSSEGPALTRSSSVDSIESLIFSIVSFNTRASSVGKQLGGAERLSNFLSEQEWLQTLSRDALQKVSLDKFEENLRRSLVQFSAHLKAEAASPIMTEAAGVVRRLARNAANLFRQSLEVPENLPSHEDVDLGRSVDSHLPPRLYNRQREYPINEDQEDEEDDDDDDDEDDDGLLEDKEREGEYDPQKMEVLLSKSVAFLVLEENLRLFVHPDPVKRALFKIWPMAYPRDSQLTIEYDLEWQVPKFLRTHFAKGQELGKVLTVTGEAINAQAQSCGDYLTHIWPEIGPVLLDGLHELLSLGAIVTKGNEVVSFDMKLGSDSDPDTDNLTTLASIVVVATHAIHEQVASALKWLCAAVRHSPHHDIVQSSALISSKKSAGSGRIIAISLAELEQIDTYRPCWHSLFPYAVIASGFPIRGRSDGKGLEISFADMALLSQSMSFTEYDAGLVVEGLRSVLIPMGLLQDGTLQWHLEYKRHEHSRKKKGVAEILMSDRLGERLKVQEPYELIEKRCFLGWAEKVAVVIGTRDFATRNIKYSGVEPTPGVRHIKSHSISIGTSGLGFFGATGSRQYQAVSIPSTITLRVDKDIYDSLDDNQDASIAIYDTGQKTAWVLRRPSILLHLINTIIRKRQYRLYDNDSSVSFKLAEPCADGGREASTTLRNSLRLKVKKDDGVWKSLSETVKQVCHMIDIVDEGVRSSVAACEAAGEPKCTYLYGVEFNELSKVPQRVEIRRAKVNQPWVRLVHQHCAVLFCNGLGQPLVPIEKGTLCNTWKQVPPGRGLMATTGKILSSFLESHDEGHRGSRLGKWVEWKREKSMIQSHSHGHHSPVFHEQILRFVQKSDLDSTIYHSIQAHISSGFVFTNLRPRTGCSENIPPVDLLPIPVVVQQSPLPSSDEDSDGDDLIDSECSSTMEPLEGTSSRSSQESQAAGKLPPQAFAPPSPDTPAWLWQHGEDDKNPAYNLESSSNAEVCAPSHLLSVPSRSLKRKAGVCKLGDLSRGDERLPRSVTSALQDLDLNPIEENVGQPPPVTGNHKRRKGKGKARDTSVKTDL